MSGPEGATLPLALPRLTRNEAQARSLLARHAKRRELLLGDIAWELSLEPLARGAATELGAADWQVRAEWAGAPFELRLPASAADQWLRARFNTLELPRLPAELRAAAFESALQDALAALDEVGQGPVRIDGVEEDGSGRGAALLSHHFGLTLTHGGHTVWATLSTDLLGLMLMAGVAEHWPAAEGPVGRASLPVTLRAEVGRATLTLAELRGLRAGDAVLLADCWVAQDGQLWLGQGHWGLRVRASGAGLEITEPFHYTELAMDDEFDAADAPEPGDGFTGDGGELSLDDMPVRLHFDLGQRSLPLGQLAELQVGQVLELGRPLSQAVHIRANGALIGTGELMEIGGRIAVGITSLRTRGEAR